MLKNERLTIILKKIQSEEANLERLIAVEEEKKGELEIQLSAVHNMLQHSDKEMQEIMLVSVPIVEDKLKFSALFIPFFLFYEERWGYGVIMSLESICLPLPPKIF